MWGQDIETVNGFTVLPYGEIKYSKVFIKASILTHLCRVTHICVGNLTIIGPDNGLSPGRRQAIIWTNAGILLIGPWGTNFSEILIGIHTFSFKKIHLKMSSAKWRPFCLGLNCSIYYDMAVQHNGGVIYFLVFEERHRRVGHQFWTRKEKIIRYEV